MGKSRSGVLCMWRYLTTSSKMKLLTLLADLQFLPKSHFPLIYLISLSNRIASASESLSQFQFWVKENWLKCISNCILLYIRHDLHLRKKYWLCKFCNQNLEYHDDFWHAFRPTTKKLLRCQVFPNFVEKIAIRIILSKFATT